MVYMDETSVDLTGTKHPVYSDDNAGRGLAAPRVSAAGMEKVWYPLSFIGFMTKNDFVQTYPRADIAGPDSDLARLVAEHNRDCESWCISIGNEETTKAVSRLIEKLTAPSIQKANALFTECFGLTDGEAESMLKGTAPMPENWEARYREFLKQEKAE